MSTPNNSDHEKIMIRRVLAAYLRFAVILVATSALASGIRYAVGDPVWFQWIGAAFIMLVPCAMCAWYIADEVTKP